MQPYRRRCRGSGPPETPGDLHRQAVEAWQSHRRLERKQREAIESRLREA